MDNITGANLGFEKEIFQVSDKLRGNIDAAEYIDEVVG
jgi:site-specific DNA-methyltransferase (adenine-specific)